MEAGGETRALLQNGVTLCTKYTRKLAHCDHIIRWETENTNFVKI